MTVYCCPRCRVMLTFRPPEARDRSLCFPHSDDYRGCNVCGIHFCESCGSDLGGLCPECGGQLYANRSFPATGVYQLPPALRELGSRADRMAALERMWQRGMISCGERENLLRVIQELPAE